MIWRLFRQHGPKLAAGSAIALIAGSCPAPAPSLSFQKIYEIEQTAPNKTLHRTAASHGTSQCEQHALA
jgi:hypothetical protein